MTKKNSSRVSEWIVYKQELLVVNLKILETKSQK